jgi:hypothetical protein
MSTYVAPVKDMLFAMNELAGLQEIATLPGNEEVSSDLVEAILDEAGKFATEVVDRSTGGRQAGQQVEGRRGDHRRRLQGSLCQLLRNRLERHAPPPSSAARACR